MNVEKFRCFDRLVSRF